MERHLRPRGWSAGGTLAFLLAATIVQAFEVEDLETRPGYAALKPSVSVSLESFGAASVKESPPSESHRELRFRRFDLGWKFPIVPLGRGFLRGAFRYGNSQINIENAVFPAYEDTTLHEATLGGSWLRPLPSHWALLLNGSMGLAGDLNVIGAECLRVGGGAAMVYGGASFIDLGLGIFYVNDYGAPRLAPVPVLVVKTRSDRFHFRLSPPLNLDTGYHPNSRWIYGFFSRPVGGRFRLKDEAGYNDLTVDYSLFQLGPYVEAATPSGIHLRIAVVVAPQPKTWLHNGDQEVLRMEYNKTRAIQLAVQVPLY